MTGQNQLLEEVFPMCKKWLRKNASFVVAVLLLGVLVGSVTGSATLTSLALCAALTLSPAAMAFADIGGEPANPGGSGDIYVPDNYQDPGIMPLERGQCTDRFSKAWCDAHGFKNNRPVPGTVKLNAKERKCYNELLITNAGLAASMVWTGPGGALVGSAASVFRLFNCLF